MFMSKCNGKDRKNESCRNSSLENSDFCKYHQYMENYTVEMLNNLTQCKGCKKQYYLPNGGTCDKCKTRGEVNRTKQRDVVVVCKKEGCKFKKSTENDFCGKHQLYYFYDQLEKKGMKACSNANRGCRVELSADYKFSKCDDCREKERTGYSTKTNQIKEKNETNDVKLCTKCGKTNDSDYSHCSDCRKAQKIQDDKRVDRKRDWKAEFERNPERAKKKKQWKEDNYDKVVSYWIKYRANRIKKEDDKYWKNNTEYHKKWVRENIDKMKEQKELDKQNPKYKLQIYKYRAEKYSIPWELTDLNAIGLMEEKCYYCNEKDHNKLNGIDRKNNECGYTLANSVPCCIPCNMIKGCLDCDIYLSRCEHILTNLKKIDGLLDYDLFVDCFPGSYSSYKCRAKRKDLDFNLSRIDWCDFLMGCCYICGKPASLNHRNGIDRIDNNKGYTVFDIENNTENNCASCCTECNYMKGIYSYDQFIEKLVMTYENRITSNNQNKRINYLHRTNREDKYGKEYMKEYNSQKYKESIERTKNKIGSDEMKKRERERKKRYRESLKNSHKFRISGGSNGRKEKKTKEQMREEAKIRKQKQRDAMKEKYGDETWKAIRSKEVALGRAKKNGNKDVEDRLTRELLELKNTI